MIIKIEREDLVGFRFLQIVICIILTIFLFFKLTLNLQFLFFCIFSYLLVFLSFIDLKYKAVPDYLLLLVFVLSFFITDFSLEDSFLNAFIASGAIFLLNFIVTFYIQNIKSRILKDENLKNQVALGEGDIPIIASMAVVLGLNSLTYAILLSAIIAILHTISINFIKKRYSDSIYSIISIRIFYRVFF